jgi:ornithine cyclodeaminase
VGIVGPGVMGKTTLMALMATCPLIDTVKIKGRSRSSLDAFTAWLGETFPRITTVQTVDTIEEVVRGSDIVTYCNSGATGDPSTYPLVKREWVKPGTFLVMPALCNIDEGMEREDVRKVVDNAGLYEAWFEELPKPAHNVVPIIGVKFMDMIHQGKMRRDRLEDIGPIVAGEAPGRLNDEEIIIMSVGGMPVEDVAWGTVVYRNAVERGIGVSLNLWDQPVLR